MMRLLLDENISPALVRLLAQVDVYSQSVPHAALAGRADHVVWQYARLLRHLGLSRVLRSRPAMKAWRKAVISLLRVALLNRRELGPLCRDRKDPQFTSFLNPTADVFTQETAPEDQLHGLPWSACAPLAFASASVMYAPDLVVPYHFVPSQW